MRHLFLAASMLAIALPSTGQARPAEVADLLKEKSVSAPDIAPDGESVVYTVREVDVDNDKSSAHIWVAKWDGSGARQLTHRAGESESSPRFSPDGKVIAFISSRDPQDKEVEDTPDRLWFLPLEGGEAYPVKGIEGSVTDFAFSPDGTKLALIVHDAKPKKEKDKKDRPEPIVIDRYLFKRDGTGYLDNRRERLWLYDIASGEAERLTDGDFDEAMPAFSPDGSRVAFVSRRLEDAERSPDYNIYVARVDKPGKVPLQVTSYEGADNGPGSGSAPAWSPDGKKIAYIRTGDPELIWYAVNDLAVVSAKGGDGLVLTEALDRNVSHPMWSADGSTISFIVEDNGVQRLASVGSSGGDVGDRKSGEWVLADPTVSDNGRIAVRAGHLGAPDEIYALEQGELRSLTRHNADLAAELDLGTVRRISFASKDGTEVRGFLKTPHGWREGNRLPTMLMIHGGPTSQYDVGFDMMSEIFAANGYAVVYVNPRGSTGRGEAYAAAIDAAWGSVDVDDVLAAVDHVVEMGVADPDKLVIGGWSYGGMLTNYTIASDTRFKAAVSGASISNVIAGYGTDHYIYEYDVELGHPWENREAWDRISYPFYENQRIVTPTLFMVGEKDINVPTWASEQMYQALRSRGIETQLVVYPGQAHGIRRPSFVIDRMERWIKWYDERVK